MAFEYGSDSLNINNPFKRQGLLYLGSGLSLLTLGIISLFTLREKIADLGSGVGWGNLFISLILLTAGVHFIISGAIKISRFYVGRGAPTSLSYNMEKSGEATNTEKTFYENEELGQMLSGRKNTTFQEPSGLFDRTVYGIFPKLLYLPISFRNYLHIIISNTGYSIIAIVIYLLALFSGSLGLTLLTVSSFADWLGILLCIYILGIWIKNPLTLKKANYTQLLNGGKKGLVWLIVLAIIIPAIGEYLLRTGVTFPEAPFGTVLPLIAVLGLTALVCVTGIMLANLRTGVIDNSTETSEYIDHWQENVHPKDIFRAFELETANLRYKEIPNRVYRELNPSLMGEGNLDKGSFEGNILMETQPIYEEIDYPVLLKTLRLTITIAGHVIISLAGLLLLLLNGTDEVLGFSFAGLFYPIILASTGLFLLNISHFYWAEMNFKSLLIQFMSEGTYTESKLSVGMAVTDSTRSENSIVRSSYSSKIYVSDVITSIQAKPGMNTLNNPRYVLTLNKNDNQLNSIIRNIRKFLDDREFIAAPNSEKDGQTIKKLYSINDAGQKIENQPINYEKINYEERKKIESKM